MSPSPPPQRYTHVTFPAQVHCLGQLPEHGPVHCWFEHVHAAGCPGLLTRQRHLFRAVPRRVRVCVGTAVFLSAPPRPPSPARLLPSSCRLLPIPSFHILPFHPIPNRCV